MGNAGSDPDVRETPSGSTVAHLSLATNRVYQQNGQEQRKTEWVNTESQPIAISNVLHYLVACLEQPATAGLTLDIGGADVLTYRAIMQTMARALGLRKRFIITVPLLTPRFLSPAKMLA